MRTAMREEIAQLKRERILEEARQLFFEQGYQGTTLDEVARQLEVTKPFIYSHFPNKAALLGEISERGTARCLEAVTRAHASGADAETKLRQAITEFVQVVIDHQANIAVYFREQQYVPAESAERISQMQGEFDQKLAAILRDGVDQGAFRIEDVKIATLAIGGMISWMFNWYRANGRLSDVQLREMMLGLILNLLKTDPAS